MSKNTKPRSESQIARDRRLIAEMYLQGYHQAVIAEQLGIDQSTVSRDLKHLLEQWRKETGTDIKERMGELEQKYMWLYHQLTVAWIRSLEDAETITKETIDALEGAIIIGGDALNIKRPKTTTRREGQSGNPALLAQAQAALKAIREMFGVDAAQKLELGGSIETSLVILPSKDG